MSFINGTIAQFQGAATPAQASADSIKAFDSADISTQDAYLLDDNALVTKAGTATLTGGLIGIGLSRTTIKDSNGGSVTTVDVSVAVAGTGISGTGSLTLDIDVSTLMPAMELPAWNPCRLVGVLNGGSGVQQVITVNRISETVLQLEWSAGATAAATPGNFGNSSFRYRTA